MSHSKFRKKGKSYYLDSWNPKGKKYIIACSRCGTKGYSPNILNADFEDTMEKEAIKDSLMAILDPIYLDEYGYCTQCSRDD